MKQQSQRNLARKLVEFGLSDGSQVKVYVKRASNEVPAGPRVFYFRCHIVEAWVTYVVILTDGLRAVLNAKGTSAEKIVETALKYVKNEIMRGNFVDGTELEFGALQEELFPAS